MSIQELCNAMIQYSDGVGFNLLVKQLGGISAINDYASSIGDRKYRLDRLEPYLGIAIPNDPRDTTTPKSMATSLQKILLSKILGNSNKNLLLTWMKNNTTGFTRIRAGVPTGWLVADKTGKGDYGTNNDIAIIYPPSSAPIVLAIYTTQNTKDAKSNDEIIVNATKIVLEELLADDYSCSLP
jgi:beta-lactamase class A